MALFCYRWGNANIPWNMANWLWSECQTVQEILTGIGNRPGVDASTLIQPWLDEPWNPYRAGENPPQGNSKRLKLIKLICKIKGQKFEEEKMMKDFKVTADDIKLVVKTVSGVDLDVKLEE